MQVHFRNGLSGTFNPALLPMRPDTTGFGRLRRPANRLVHPGACRCYGSARRSTLKPRIVHATAILPRGLNGYGVI